MPKAQIPVGYSKAEAQGRYGPCTWANVMYFDTVPSDPGFPADVFAAVGHVVGTFYSTVFDLTIMPSNWTVDTCKVTYRADDTSIYTARVADAHVGTSGAAGQDAQVSYLINWITGDPRKGGKPRQYVCGVVDNAVLDPATLTAARVSGVNANLATWLGAFPYTSGTAHVAGLVEMSFRNDKAYIDPPFPRPVIGGVLSPIVATQRRRVDRLRSS